MKSIALFLSLAVIYFNQFSPLHGQSNQLSKNSKGKGGVKDRYFSKSYGEVQFNKYRGQLPPKGVMIECAIDCLSLATCHCIGLNIQTSECHFYGLEESPSYDSWKVTTGNAGSNSLAQVGTNWTNKDYIFFTRDIFADDSVDKVDIAAGRKVLTSWSLEESKVKKPAKGSKGKEQPKNGKAKSKQNKSQPEGFPQPWIQIEFKETMYITEIVLQSTKEYSSELKQLQIRIGNESIAKFYDNPENGNVDESGEAWSGVKPFERNAVCFEHQPGLSSAGLFAAAVKKQKLLHKTVKCQPCGLAGRFLSIQTFEPCEKCKLAPTNQTNTEVDSKKPQAKSATVETPTQRLPLPLISLQVFGYAVGGKGRD